MFFLALCWWQNKSSPKLTKKIQPGCCYMKCMWCQPVKQANIYVSPIKPCQTDYNISYFNYYSIKSQIMAGVWSTWTIKGQPKIQAGDKVKFMKLCNNWLFHPGFMCGFISLITYFYMGSHTWGPCIGTSGLFAKLHIKQTAVSVVSLGKRANMHNQQNG